jgi:hypothetical protein
MVALRASRPAFLFPYTSQIHARSVAHTPFQTVSGRRSRKFVIEGCVKRRLMTSLLRCRGVNLREERRGCGDPSRTYPLR